MLSGNAELHRLHALACNRFGLCEPCKIACMQENWRWTGSWAWDVEGMTEGSDQSCDIGRDPAAPYICGACAARADLATTTAAARPPWAPSSMETDLGASSDQLRRAASSSGSLHGGVPSSSSMSSVNGHVTSFVYRDWVAVVCGVVAVMLGVTAWSGGPSWMGCAKSQLLRMQANRRSGIAVMLFGELSDRSAGSGVASSGPTGGSQMQRWTRRACRAT